MEYVTREDIEPLRILIEAGLQPIKVFYVEKEEASKLNPPSDNCNCVALKFLGLAGGSVISVIVVGDDPIDEAAAAVIGQMNIYYRSQA